MNNELFLSRWDANLAKGDMTNVALAVICRGSRLPNTGKSSLLASSNAAPERFSITSRLSSSHLNEAGASGPDI
jgi:hypothetical protein